MATITNQDQHNGAGSFLSPLRQIKFVLPQTSTWFTHRPRIRELLDRASAFPFTMVVAPPGYGKTSAISNWVSTREQPTAWLSIDETDNGLAQFVASVLAAIQTVVPGIGLHTSSLLRFGDQISAQQFASTLASELLELDHTITLVLDDLQIVTDLQAIAFLTELVRLPPPTLRIVAAGRAQTNIPLTMLRAKGYLYEISQTDLAFTETEIGEFLETVFGQAIPSDVVSHLSRTSEGWIVGLYFSALSAHQKQASVDTLVDGPNFHAVMEDYIAHEMLDQFDDVVLGYVLRLSIPVQINEQLAAQLTADLPRETLGENPFETLRQRGLFLAASTRQGVWYRFHALVRGILLNRLHELHSEADLEPLHSIAFRWFEDNGDIEAALGHAIAAGYSDEAADLMIRHAQELLIEDRWQQLARCLDLLPPDRIAEDIELLTASAWVYQIRGRHDKMRATVARARQVIEKNRSILDEAHYHRWKAELDIMSVLDVTTSYSLEQRTILLKNAYDALVGTGRFAELYACLYYPAYLARIDTEKARTLVEGVISECALDRSRWSTFKTLWARHGYMMLLGSQGDMQDWHIQATYSFAEADHLGISRMIAQAQFFLGWVQYEHNELQIAEHALRSALQNPDIGILILIGCGDRLARVLTTQGRHSEAEDLLQSLSSRLYANQSGEFLPMLRLTHARIALTRGDLQLALSILRLEDIDLKKPMILQAEPAGLLYACAIMLDPQSPDLVTARKILTELENDPATVYWKDIEFQIHQALALLDYLEGNKDAAASRLGPLLTLAEKRGYRRALLDVHPRVIDLLAWYREEVEDTTYLRSLLEIARKVEEKEQSKVSESSGCARNLDDLSEREIEVLAGLQQRLTNKEIAAMLGISTLTVKSHTRNIYGKLDANSRRQAVAIAVKKGILPEISSNSLISGAG